MVLHRQLYVSAALLALFELTVYVLHVMAR
jgi:hypothetical protein